MPTNQHTERTLDSGQDEYRSSKKSRTRTKKRSKEEGKLSGEEDRVWRTDGKPPMLDSQAKKLLVKLTSILSTTSQLKLSQLVNGLIDVNPSRTVIPTGPHEKFIYLLSSCVSLESETVINDFIHMMSLFELACYISG
jgi:hypothetical protein